MPLPGFSRTHAAMVLTLLREGRVEPDDWTRPEREAVTRLHQYRDTNDSDALVYLEAGRTLCCTIGLVLLVVVAVLTVTTLLGLLIVPWTALIGVGLLGLVLLLLDGSTPA